MCVRWDAVAPSFVCQEPAAAAALGTPSTLAVICASRVKVPLLSLRSCPVCLCNPWWVSIFIWSLLNCLQIWNKCFFLQQNYPAVALPVSLCSVCFRMALDELTLAAVALSTCCCGIVLVRSIGRHQGNHQQAMPSQFSLLLHYTSPQAIPKISVHLTKMENISEGAASSRPCEASLWSSALPLGEEGLQDLFKELLVHLSIKIQKINIFKVVIGSCFWDWTNLSYECFEAPPVQEWGMNDNLRARAISFL